MAEHTSRTAGVDYDMAPTLQITEPAQLKAFGHQLRLDIIALLSERAATGSQLADALDAPVGTVGHHLGVLEDAGLVRVVRTKQVRAITAKYYGRTAAVFLFDEVPPADVVTDVDAWRRKALPDPAPIDGMSHVGTTRFARLPADRYDEWLDRITELSVEFATQPAEGDVVWALSLHLYPTTRRPLPPDDDEAERP